MKNNRVIKNILIIRTDYLGDMLVITPVISSLRQFFPEASIKGLVNSLIGQKVLEHHPDINETRRFPPQRPYHAKDLWELIKWIRSEKFDLLLAFASRDDRISVLSLLSGAKQKIGYDLGLFSRSVYNTAVPNDRTRHEVERNLDFLRALDLEPQTREMVFEITPDETRAIDELWRKLELPAQVIGIHPRSKRMVKNWPPERFQVLAEKLYERYSLPLVFTGIKDDFEVIETIRSRIKEKTFNVAGQTTLGELAALIKRFRLFITIDSGPMHLAAALKTPQVVLFGAGEISKWYPWGDKSRNLVVYKEVGCQPCSLQTCESMKCMQSITVDDILEGVASLWLR